MKKRISVIITALLLVAFFAGCKSSETPAQPTDNNDIPAVTEDVVTDDPEEESEQEIPDSTETSTEEDLPDQEPETIPEPLFINPLTGLACDEATVSKRPVAMMINNIKQAVPQLGISNADIMYECIVEGGITRLMCLFSSYESLPVTGSVRSSRDYYLDLAQAHDAIYAHCGGSEMAYSTIAERRIDNVDGVRGSQAEANAYWKDADRVKNMGYEHASMTSGEKLSGAISALGMRTTLNDGFSHPLAFLPEETPFEGSDAVSVTISYAGNYSRSFFVFDETASEYKKGQYGAAHIDLNTEKALSFENILILGVTYHNTGDSYNHLEMYFTGEGKGYYISNGKMKNIVWKKSDRQTPYSLYEQDGVTPLLLNPGKSYIGFANGLSQASISATADYVIE